MNQSQFLAINCNSPEAREKSRVHGAIGFGFASRWLKNSQSRNYFRQSFENCYNFLTRDHFAQDTLNGLTKNREWYTNMKYVW